MLSEETGKDLLDEIKHREFRRFNSNGVTALTREIDETRRKIDTLKRVAEEGEVTLELSINFALLKAYKERNERILRAYRFFRFQSIQEYHFSKDIPQELMIPDELAFLDEFKEITTRYLDNYRHLTLSDRSPPLDFFVQILTLEDCGAVLCGDDFIELKKDRIYFLKRSDITHRRFAKSLIFSDAMSQINVIESKMRIKSL